MQINLQNRVGRSQALRVAAAVRKKMLEVQLEQLRIEGSKPAPAPRFKVDELVKVPEWDFRTPLERWMQEFADAHGVHIYDVGIEVDEEKDTFHFFVKRDSVLRS